MLSIVCACFVHMPYECVACALAFVCLFLCSFAWLCVCVLVRGWGCARFTCTQGASPGPCCGGPRATQVIGSRHPQGYWMCLDQLQAWCLDDGRYDTPAGASARAGARGRGASAHARRRRARLPSRAAHTRATAAPRPSGAPRALGQRPSGVPRHALGGDVVATTAHRAQRTGHKLAACTLGKHDTAPTFGVVELGRRGGAVGALSGASLGRGHVALGAPLQCPSAAAQAPLGGRSGVQTALGQRSWRSRSVAVAPPLRRRGSEASFLTRWRRRLRPASPSGSPSSSSAEGWWRRRPRLSATVGHT